MTMLAAVALASLLLILLVAPMLLGTHVVVVRANRRWTRLWFLTVIGLMAASLVLAAVGLVFSELTR